ncbi:MAG TPA: hypothetical protein VGL13_08045 [Polyangiaceae bacterium]
MKARFAAVLATLVPLLASAQGAADSSNDPVLLNARTGTMVRRNQFRSWHPAWRGQLLLADMELMCEHGCSVRTFDGSVLTLADGAYITIGQQMFVPLSEGQAALGRRFDLREGYLSVNVSKDTHRPHTVIVGGPNDVAAALRPGQSQLVVSQDRFGIACVTSSARIKRGSEILPLQTGQATAIVDRGAALTSKPLGAPPSIRGARAKQGELQPLAVSLTENGARPGFEWEAVTGASAYKIDISPDPTFHTLVDVAKVDGSTTRYLAKNLPQGTYYGRVTSYDESGLASMPSESAQLSVVALRVPNSGAVDSERSAVVAPPGAVMGLSDNESLELAKEGGYFHAAPSDIVVDAQPRIVRLRRKGDFGHETRVVVEPRGLRADIKLSPFWARWPEDGVDVTVTLVDPTGRIDPLTVEPQLEVMVGLEPLAVEWKREGNRLTTHIDPRAATHPEVVRVIAKDRDGAPLGRNFLEIEPVFAPRLAGQRTPLAHR